MNPEKLQQLQINPAQKERPRTMVRVIVTVVLLVIAGAFFYAWPRKSDETRTLPKQKETLAATNHPASETAPAPITAPSSTAPSSAAPPSASAPKTTASDAVLTVSGYIVNHERIEISPRFPGVVKWIGVKKGDAVTKDQIVVLLDDAEQKAQVAQAEGRLATAKVSLARAELNYRRIHELWDKQVSSKDAEDQARLDVEAAGAAIAEIEGQLAQARTYLDWTVIKSPINGVVLEKLAEPGELVTPQSFGGPRGPSTALLAVADPRDLQVEIDVNESDLAKISPGQKCRVSPEAYPDRFYDGAVAEISPEANRSKGTLQIKVQIKDPDKHLTPELSAKVDFLKE
jgi:HlyD family secretion protein